MNFADILAMGKQQAETIPSRLPPTRIAFSSIVLDVAKSTLQLTGWCLTKHENFGIVISADDGSFIGYVDKLGIERLDVFKNYPDYEDKNAGWTGSFKLPSALRLTLTGVSATFIAPNTLIKIKKPVERINDVVDGAAPATSAAPVVAAPAKLPVITVDGCNYSPLRSIIAIKGKMKQGKGTEILRVTSPTGRQIPPVHQSMSRAADKSGHDWSLTFKASGVSDKEVLHVSIQDVDTPDVIIPIGAVNDSPTRALALQPAVIASPDGLQDPLVAEELLPYMPYRWTHPGKPRRSRRACYFPPFHDGVRLSDHYHRAAWYLTGTDSPFEEVSFYSQVGDEILPRPEYMGGDRHQTDAIRVVTDYQLVDYVEALRAASVIVIWRPISKEIQTFLSTYLPNIFSGAGIVTVANDDTTAVEYGKYCNAQWSALTLQERQNFLDDSHKTFKEVLQRQRDAGKSASAIFGTGPSLDTAMRYDFSNCMTIACNTIVANDELLDHLNPAFICAGDVVSHFGISTYAEKFREQLFTALAGRDAYFLTSASQGYLLSRKYPEFRDKIISCGQSYNGLNIDLENEWSLPKFDSTLNIHMLPIAATFSNTVFLLGFDGKNPDPESNEDFWAHSQSAHYHDMVDTGHLCHPTFDLNRQAVTHDRYLASTTESFMAGECFGKAFYSLAPSFTPAIKARPAPGHLLIEDAASGLVKVGAMELSSQPRTGKRAVIVSRMLRHLFSGGRYHATVMAEALAYFCDEVVIWTENVPFWTGDLATAEHHGRVTYWVNALNRPPEGDFDYVIVVPDTADSNSMYYSAVALAHRNEACLVLLNFESPNWFNAMSPAPRPWKNWSRWYATACFSDIVLSSAAVSTRFAKDFYKTLFNTPQFRDSPPAINDGIAEIVYQRKLPKQKQVIAITRFGGNVAAHKNVDGLFALLPEELRGYTLCLIVGTAALPSEEEITAVRERLAEAGVELKLLHMISDLEKYEEIAKSELMIFPSLFEGFGYPPIEARFVGTRCVAFDLPVLKEFSDGYVDFVPWGDFPAMRERIGELLRSGVGMTAVQDDDVRRFATIESFAARLKTMLEEPRPRSAVANYTREKFDLALKEYLKTDCELSELAKVHIGPVESEALLKKLMENVRQISQQLSRANAFGYPISIDVGGLPDINGR